MIHVVTPYGRQGPSSRVRVFEWLDRVSAPVQLSSYVSHRNASPSHLARRPVAVLTAERCLRQMASRGSERLLLHREASPLSRGGLERRLLLRAEFGVYDFDDALQSDSGAGGLYRRWAPKAAKALIAVQGADRVIAGNPVLAEWASEYNRDVVVIPSCVAPASYRQKSDYAVGDPPRLGWIGSADNEVYLLAIAEALREVHRQTGARLTLLGTTKPRLGDLEGVIDRVQWSEVAQHAMLADFDLGLGPVPDEPYTRGKSGYKLLQYAAAGTPMVASPVGVNEQILAQTSMPAARDSSEWTDAILDHLTRPADGRAAAGRHARGVVQAQYSFDAWLARWQDATGIRDRGENEGRITRSTGAVSPRSS
jgi:glycosyltransferase involved in cell wall biosynthesis